MSPMHAEAKVSHGKKFTGEVEEEQIFIASAKGRYGHNCTPTPQNNNHERYEVEDEEEELLDAVDCHLFSEGIPQSMPFMI